MGRSLVAIVDDDESVRESVPDLLRQFGFEAKAFESAEALLLSDRMDAIDCLILDIVMPGMSGPDLQQELAHRGHRIPIVFISAQGDPGTRTRVLAAGAAAVLAKPFSEADLLEAINGALRTG
jgi:FixJ family two-component response regulator